MTGLLLKDWKLFKNQGRYFFTILIIAMAILLINSQEYSTFATSYITFLLAYFTLSTISYDEYDNGMGFLMTLPVSRRTYVKEKYLLCILLTVGAWLLAFMLNVLFFIMNDAAPEKWKEILCTNPVFLLVVLVFLSFSLPLFLKFGPEKGRMVSFGILGVGMLMIFLMARLGIGVSAADSLDTVSLEQPALVAGVSFFVSILAIAISYMVSANIMDKREF